MEKLDTLPLFDNAKVETGSGLPKWSGADKPPEIGQCIDIKMNSIGAAKVDGYFVEDGWLGLITKPVNPPEWFIKQNGYDATAYVFGAEVKGVVDEPVIVGPNQVQLASLKRFADEHGRTWKDELSSAWQTGNYHGSKDYGSLQQIRNQFGGEWLFSPVCTIKPAEEKHLPAQKMR